MDSRLKKILDASTIRKAESDRILAKQSAEKHKIEIEKLKKDILAASAWVEEHLFNLIEKADKANKDHVELSDHRFWSDPKTTYDGIPAYLLAAEVRKIEGLRIE